MSDYFIYKKFFLLNFSYLLNDLFAFRVAFKRFEFSRYDVRFDNYLINFVYYNLDLKKRVVCYFVEFDVNEIIKVNKISLKNAFKSYRKKDNIDANNNIIFKDRVDYYYN